MITAKIKKINNKVKVECTKCFNPIYIKFNLSHITYDKEVTDQDKIAIFNRMRELSEHPYLTVANWNKQKGFETINLDIKKDLPINFRNNHENVDNKFTIIRIYPHNFPTAGRLIGKMINKIFYIFYIDVKGKLYTH